MCCCWSPPRTGTRIFTHVSCTRKLYNSTFSITFWYIFVNICILYLFLIEISWMKKDVTFSSFCWNVITLQWTQWHFLYLRDLHHSSHIWVIEHSLSVCSCSISSGMYLNCRLMWWRSSWQVMCSELRRMKLKILICLTDFNDLNVICT